jgi:hypothetical protein
MYNEHWEGVNFGDATSPDSPLDVSTCGKQEIERMRKDEKNNVGDLVAYVASDNVGSVRQINSTLGWNRFVECVHVYLHLITIQFQFRSTTFNCEVFVM